VQEVNANGVPLVRTNHQAIGAECEALLVTASNQLFERSEVELSAVRRQRSE
jgi:hypothetical protein